MSRIGVPERMRRDGLLNSRLFAGIFYRAPHVHHPRRALLAQEYEPVFPVADNSLDLVDQKVRNGKQTLLPPFALPDHDCLVGGVQVLDP